MAQANGHSKGEKKNFNVNVTAYTKTNSKWITELNVKHKTVRKKPRRKSSGPRAR